MKLKDYKVGVYFGGYYENKKLYCSCGHTTLILRNEPKVCVKCGNRHVVDGGSHFGKKRIHDGIYECVEKDDKSFHIKKQEILVKVDDKGTSARKIHDWELKYNLKDKSVELFKDGNKAACHQHNHNNINQFFKNIKGESQLIPLFSTENSQHLYDFAYKEYGSTGYERVKKLGRALMRLIGKSSKLELFAFAGFGQNLPNISRCRSWIESSETKPHKIFGVPKYMLPVLRELGRFSEYQTGILASFDRVIGGNNVKIVIEILKEEADLKSLFNIADVFTSLYSTYGYKDVKKLTLYLAREVKLEQGISSPATAITTLRDYVRMCKEMDVAPKEKYPKSLKKLHDIAQMNHKVKADEVKNSKMREVVDSEDYQELTYKKKPYAIVAPQDASDLIKEGSSLSHCVASYVTDVIDKKCKILFLREAEALDKSLVTIEVRDSNIRQVRGFGNRAATPIEMDFVREWAEKKQLKLATY